MVVLSNVRLKITVKHVLIRVSNGNFISVSGRKLMKYFFPAEKAAGNPGGKFPPETKFWCKIFGQNIFHWKISVGNPFLSDLWSGHDETYTVHNQPKP